MLPVKYHYYQKYPHQERINVARVYRRKKREAIKRKIDELVEYYNKKANKKVHIKMKERRQEYWWKVKACRDRGGNFITK